MKRWNGLFDTLIQKTYKTEYLLNISGVTDRRNTTQETLLEVSSGESR